MEGGGARFMVFTVELGPMSSLERSLQRKIEKVAMWVRLDANTTNDLLLGRARLILQEEVMFEEWEIGVDGKIALA
jgi:hypothetical protein